MIRRYTLRGVVMRCHPPADVLPALCYDVVVVSRPAVLRVFVLLAGGYRVG